MILVENNLVVILNFKREINSCLFTINFFLKTKMTLWKLLIFFFSFWLFLKIVKNYYFCKQKYFFGDTNKTKEINS